jgi:Flp pilus assembly protein TadD
MSKWQRNNQMSFTRFKMNSSDPMGPFLRWSGSSEFRDTRPGFQLGAIFAVCGLAALFLVAPALAHSEQQGTGAIVGSVHDSAGNGIADASVRLQARGASQGEEHRTDSTGNFGFSELKTGAYVLSASKGEKHSNEVTVSLVKGGATQRVDLTLSSQTNPEFALDRKNPKAEMEFSDVPNFTVAAVTDWTAAGGHGSDSSLRTSEALTRETLRLKQDEKGAALPQSAAKDIEQQLRSAVKTAPLAFKANEDLGRFYIRMDRYPEAVAPLRTAYQVDPSNVDAEYELALALARNGDAVAARPHVEHLLGKGGKPEWHRLAGEVDEKTGDPLSAVHEFELAVKGDPSEDNYFAWGSELMQHRAIWQAKDVFESGARVYPRSPRMLTALGAALFGGAMYEEAAQRLCEASDLNPNDAEPYLFMGKVEIAAPDHLPCIETKLERFVSIQPGNPLANYFYAMAYWKEHGKKADPETLQRVETYLNKAVQADPQCSSAYLQLGVLRASQADFKAASTLYQRAIAADPQSTEAHYRLGVAYDRLGEKAMAGDEFRRHDELEKQQAAEVDRQRKEVKQFLVQVGGNAQDRPARP